MLRLWGHGRLPFGLDVAEPRQDALGPDSLLVGSQHACNQTRSSAPCRSPCCAATSRGAKLRHPAPRCRRAPTSIFLQHSSLSPEVSILFRWPPLQHDQAFISPLKLAHLLLTPERAQKQANADANPTMDAERGRCVPRIRKVGRLGVRFNWAQAVGRLVSVLFELGAVCFIAWLYSYWRTEPTTRVDVLFPSFFPVGWIRCAVIPPRAPD